MANLPETPQWEDGIYQIEVSDPVLGGPDGISNRQAKQLASRTSYLKQQVEKGSSDLSEHIKAADPHTQYAPKASPTFTGNPAAPTVVKTDNSTKLANTAHVKTVVADYAPLASPALTGTPTAPTAPQTVNNTQIATTAFVKSALAALVASSPEALDTLNELAAALGNDPNFATTMTNALAGKQPLDNTLTALSGKSVAALLEYLGLGEALKKGDFGIGGILKAMASAAESGFYLSASGSDDNPEKELGFVIINMAASGHYKTQIAVAYAPDIPRAYIRNIFGDAKQPWEQIATKAAIDALNAALSGKQPKGDYLPKNSPAADTRISVTAQDYPVVSLHQTSTGDMFEIVATPTRNSLLFKHTAKNGTTKQVGIPFAEIESGADIGGQRIRKLYSGSGASLGQSFSFGTNGVGKTLIMFHDGVAKIQIGRAHV